jgi:starch phosphorylase
MGNPIFPHEINNFAGMEDLVEMAFDLRWSWNHGADDIWRSMDPALWELTRNPWIVLQTVARGKLKELTENREFRRRLKEQLQQMRAYRKSRAWFQMAYPRSRLKTVAYFSMEFMLGEALPIYSGGLGNVAGDQLKAASDLGVPVVGVGLLYQEGYFRQVIAADGSQLALYPINDPGQLQISPARDANGEWVRIPVHLPGYSVWVRAWQAQVGRVKLYMLDMNDPANPPVVRGITNELYGGGHEVRIAQEMVLGIGGWKLLRRLGIDPEVCHLNEGHAAFAVLERTAEFMKRTGHGFEVALQVTRAGNLFTTHTPVAAGFDRFSPHLMRQNLEEYAKAELGISFRRLMALGRQNPDDDSEPFNMAYLALRGSGAVNGVSKLHGKVSREIFQSLFPRWPQGEVPIGSVTNGIHVPTWDSRASDELWTRYGGKACWQGGVDDVSKSIRKVPDKELWAMRQESRLSMIEHIRSRYARQLAVSGAPIEEINRAQDVLNPEVLTLGFARRFAEYKRPVLLLYDQERFIRILTNPRCPVQILVAGKAHPADGLGQDMIRQWTRFARRPEVKGRAIFLSDYDMLLTEQIVGGVDVWINNPRRPWEACGTSGMKVLVNGGLNLSELDGWWAEAYRPEVGWALGDGLEHGDDLGWDAEEAESLYSILENEVIPQFYARNAEGLPVEWLSKVRESMVTLTADFSAQRAVRQYTMEYYVPAAEAYEARRADKCASGLEMADRRLELQKNWHSISFGAIQIESWDGQHHFRLEVDFGGVDPEAARVELFALCPDGSIFRQPMEQGGKLIGSKRGYEYTAKVPATRPSGDFTPRIIPEFPGLAVPLEIPCILWHH